MNSPVPRNTNGGGDPLGHVTTAICHFPASGTYTVHGRNARNRIWRSLIVVASPARQHRWLALRQLVPACVWLFLASHARGDSVFLFPAADTTLSENYPANNFGAQHFLIAGTTQNFTKNRGLLRFDLADAIPAGSVITAAALTLEVTGEPGDGYNASNFGLHRVLRGWAEGDKSTPPGSTSPGSGAPAGPGEANWLYRFAATTGAWGEPGGAPGLDYAPRPSATTTIYGVSDSPYTFGSSEGLVADVRSWLDHPEANFGWMLISGAESLDFTARRFGSREDSLNAPYLVVDFVPIPEPHTLGLVLIALVFLRRRVARRR